MHHIGQQFTVLDIEIDRVSQENTGNAEDRQPDSPAAKLAQHKDTHDSRNNVHRVVQLGFDPGCHQVRSLESIIEKGCRTQHNQYNIIPGHMIDLHMSFFSRIGQVTHDYDQSEE